MTTHYAHVIILGAGGNRVEPKDTLAKRQGRKQAEATRLPPVGFWSYARQDDQLSSGRLTGLRSLLVQELQQQYGREPVRLFQDNDTIPHGSDWEEEIRKAINASTFFIPIITPNFVQSEWCCREVELFIEREQALRAQYPELAGSSRMFPILFIGIDDADPEDPAVLAALQKLQWFDFRRFRHRNFEDPEIREALSDFVGTMRSLLKAKLGSAASASGGEGETASGKTPKKKAGGAERTTAPTEIVEAASRANRRAEESRPVRPIEVGDVLNHMFEVKRFIKAGGMGQVFEGSNALTGERVAIKALLPALAADPKVTQLFQREAMTLTRLSNEALVQYRAMAKEPDLGALYIVTEYVDGVDLGEVLDQVECDNDELEHLLTRLAGGLASAHRLGAIHRDISPDNIMLPGGDLSQAKIIDFGIAKDLGGALPTLIGEGFAGKLSFVAPEQLGEHGGKVGPWTDVYSLGLVILSVARREKVDVGGSFADAIRKRREEIDVSAAPESLRPVLAAMLRHDPADRLKSMDEVTALLAASSSTQVADSGGDAPPSEAEDVVVREVEARDERPRRTLWSRPPVLALAAIILLIGVVFAFSRERTPNAPESAFHLQPRDIAFSFDGLLGRYDNRQLQRGLQVYREICSSCHSLRRVSFRDLQGLGYSEAQVRTLASEWPAQVPSIDPRTGEPASRPGTPADHIPTPFPNDVAARLANNNALPPDLSQIANTHERGPAYVASLMTGYADPATYRNEQGQSLPAGQRPSAGMYFNPYFANLTIAMPPSISADGQVSYADGTPATREQMAIDVSAFLAWAADPNLERRHQIIIFAAALVLLVAAGLAYLVYRRVRANARRIARLTMDAARAAPALPREPKSDEAGASASSMDEAPGIVEWSRSEPPEPRSPLRHLPWVLVGMLVIALAVIGLVRSRGSANEQGAPTIANAMEQVPTATKEGRMPLTEPGQLNQPPQRAQPDVASNEGPSRPAPINPDRLAELCRPEMEAYAIWSAQWAEARVARDPQMNPADAAQYRLLAEDARLNGARSRAVEHLINSDTLKSINTLRVEIRQLGNTTGPDEAAIRCLDVQRLANLEGRPLRDGSH